MKTTKKRTRRPARGRSALPTHSFTLYFSGGGEELSEEALDALYEAGCGDALVGMCNGEVFIDFDREAPSFRIALTSAIANVERAGVGLELIRVEPS
jgi:hypothetical protein